MRPGLAVPLLPASPRILNSPKGEARGRGHRQPLQPLSSDGTPRPPGHRQQESGSRGAPDAVTSALRPAPPLPVEPIVGPGGATGGPALPYLEDSQPRSRYVVWEAHGHCTLAGHRELRLLMPGGRSSLPACRCTARLPLDLCQTRSCF